MTTGTRIGPYEVVAKLGAGGMGEVYRARDTKLGRDVALKILPESFASDPDRLMRFEREAKTLASLNHPNIAAIYGIEESESRVPSPESGSTRALVMELVEGEDLSARIARGAVELDDALPIARQIAEALEAAHEAGVIHRDLKPANIKVRPDGAVKVLDFGLAKALDGGLGPRNSGLGMGAAADAATVTSPALTAMGLVLGTAAYMSPEQARGRPVDRRADIWAFGVVLYEMLTGRRLFDPASDPGTPGAGSGDNPDSVSDVIAAVLRSDINLSALPASTPASVRRLVARCLDRNPKTRLQHIGEARIALAAPADDPAEGVTPPAPAPRQTTPLAMALAAALILMTSTAGYLALRPAPESPLVRLDLRPPEGAFLPALSPDGRTVAFGVREGNSSSIWLRPIGAGAAYPLGGTEDGANPFWSPDSREVGFMVATAGANRQVKKVPVGGGQAAVLGEWPCASASWGRDDVIVGANCGFNETECSECLYRLPATGGTATRTSRYADGVNARWVSFLPDGRHFVFASVTTDPEQAGIYVGELDSDERTRLSSVMSSARYAAGHLLFVLNGTLVAQPFDADALQFTGDPVPVFEDIMFREPSYRGNFSVSDEGLVAEALPPEPLRQLTWADRSGARVGTLEAPADLLGPRLSPDSRRLAVARADRPGGIRDLWTLDLERNVFSRLRAGPVAFTAFSPDGMRIAFVGRDGLGVMSTSGGGEAVLAAPPANFIGHGWAHGLDWSTDGERLVITTGTRPKVTQTIRPDGSEAVAIGGFDDVVLSRDSAWLAFSEGGAVRQVFVAPYTGEPGDGSNRIQVSPNGGAKPRWRADGRELFYVSPDGQLMAVPVTREPRFALGTPTPLFDVPASVTYDVTADGQRFILALPVTEPVDPPLSVIINWRAMMPR